MRMSDADVLYLEQELENIIGAQAGARADTASTALDVVSDLTRAGGGVARTISTAQKQKALEEEARKKGVSLVPMQPQPQAENPFMRKAGGVPVYGWILIGVGSIAAIGIVASMLKKR